MSTSLASHPFQQGSLTSADTASPTFTVLRPSSAWSPINPIELWRYRDLLWLLAHRDIQVRYKQTALGIIWALLQPVAVMAVLSVVLGRFLGVTQTIGQTPYPIFLYSGLLPWTFFSAAVIAAGNSVVSNANMLQKVYFPRLIMPLASIGAPLLDFFAQSFVLFILIIWYQTKITWGFALLPLILLNTILTALGVGIFMAALTVAYRDFRYVISFLLQVWFFLTPVILPDTAIPYHWRWLWSLNPMTGVVCAFRSAVLGTPINYDTWLISLSASVIFLTVGLLYFSRTQRRFADIV